MHNRAEHPDRATAAAAPAAEQIRWTRATDEQITAEAAVKAPPDDETPRPVRGQLERAPISLPADDSGSPTYTAEALAAAYAEIEQIRAHATAEIAATREQTNRAVAELERTRSELDNYRRDGPTAFVSSQVLAMPIPPTAIGAHTGPIEEALSTARRLGYLLELSAADEAERHTLDAELVGSLLNTVQQQAANLSEELHDLCSRHASAPHAQAANYYATAAAHTYCALLQRIADATQQLAARGENTDGVVVELITQMLANHPWQGQ